MVVRKLIKLLPAGWRTRGVNSGGGKLARNCRIYTSGYEIN